MLDKPVSGRVFFEQVIRDNLDAGRPDQVSLIFGRHLKRWQPAHPRTVPHPGHHQRRHPEPARRLQAHHDQAVPQGRTSATDRDHHQRHPRFPDRQTADQSARPAGDRLLRQPASAALQRLSHDPITGSRAITAITSPAITPAGTRIPGLRLAQPRSHALLAALLIFRLQPRGFTNRDLRDLTAQLRGLTHVSTGQVTYDLRRLRTHQLIERVPGTHRYQVTDTGLHTAMILTRLHDRILPAGFAQLTASTTPGRLRRAATAYQAAIDDIIRDAGLAA